MALNFTEIDNQTARLKKARAVLALLTDAAPANGNNEDSAWAVALAFDLVHDVIVSLDEQVEQHAREIRQRGTGHA